MSRAAQGRFVAARPASRVPLPGHRGPALPGAKAGSRGGATTQRLALDADEPPEHDGVLAGKGASRLVENRGFRLGQIAATRQDGTPARVPLSPAEGQWRHATSRRTSAEWPRHAPHVSRRARTPFGRGTSKGLRSHWRRQRRASSDARSPRARALPAKTDAQGAAAATGGVLEAARRPQAAGGEVPSASPHPADGARWALPR